ncbi:ATP-binding protein [Roseococcus pinisoli]|uniref:histidine kinase n=1 Tax=Roseococcus pinisoli TaxID=2835040 RepID=A0ABS5QIV7_9PROT|nr:ATP-binding protein [Roseococcus pinisoli]MBS7813619.1 HAMP domain-containing protein [Roseococcus pinisoli]
MRRLRAWFWPDGLAGRTTLVLLTGLLALHLGSVWIHEASLRGSHQDARERAIAEGLSQARRALSLLPPVERDRAAHALSSPALELHWREGIPPRGNAEDRESLNLVRQWLVRIAPDLHDIVIGWGDAAEHHLLVGALPLGNGGSISFAAPVFRTSHSAVFDPGGVLALATIAVVIGLASIFLVRGLTKPLRELSKAADRVGRDVASIRIAEEGPAEIRQAARAFNGMQDRIRRLLDERTQALAAVSHDLRTPITRLRLLAGFLDDTQARDRIDASLDEMAAMVETTLDYLREGQELEEPRPTDLVAVLRTICDDASDAGGDVTFEGPEKLVASLRLVAMRRALANLVGNAVTYGGNARVTLCQHAADLIIEIADDGPGIPEAALEQVFEPFRRLEESRNRATGGVGLGLTIARRAAEAEGGSLRLVNRPGGGLSALVTLPARRAAEPPALPSRAAAASS